MTSTPPSGEAGLLARMLPHLSPSPLAEVGPGDDAAVLRLPSSRLVVSTDTLTEGVDFLPGVITPTQLGRRAAVQNLADIAAMGARPHALVVSVSAPAGTDGGVFEEIAAALGARAEADGAHVVGGDLGRGDLLSLTVTALGTLAAGEAPVLRSGARPGDLLAVGTERLGRSAAGLAAVLAGRDEPAELVAFHHAPEVDLRLGWTVGRAASAMLDLSDGLVRDGGRIAAASGVVLDLDPAALTPDIAALRPSARDEAEASAWVLHGGEEHAMLATFPPGAVPAGFRVLGAVRPPAPGEEPTVLLGGERIPGRGFDHFDDGS
ncbi:thiamine-phosphate kinase [Brachybacterium sp. J153]|uniref:thiamine-phosphate kinase n=1 Tax=Brachybacterium sp. J153 TaxID=3116488 RepID=UPI002E79BF20|nr:thiamine-phosphate kinase [Brachybacterium sp. J153]MEE1617164.1 thiamine-phosphate kinase [Brachybacterium sp. J153]